MMPLAVGDRRLPLPVLPNDNRYLVADLAFPPASREPKYLLHFLPTNANALALAISPILRSADRTGAHRVEAGITPVVAAVPQRTVMGHQEALPEALY